jgi:hypothetical protein
MSSIEEKWELIHKAFLSLDRLRYPFEPSTVPLNGLYVFFEKGELSHGHERVVRIGTHTGKDQLRSRLMQHLVKENKDRSIFRKNIGRALLNRDNNIKMLDMWNRDMTPKMAREHMADFDIPAIKEVEGRVSDYMRSRFSFATIEVLNKEDRLMLESRLISTISLCEECSKPSPNWLGNSSPIPKIRKSGLWLVNELYKEPFGDKELEQFLYGYFPKM